eukprot:TRINITY_DN10216_c0_g1_i10.p1 TRINITY_DN10216_c0_g1~~TRINITY_DN10216_c0_g1_i10.p1  ORF type:complete len:227 (-),score=33.30 TRINITY_DN10216_c0_g1_i10:142-822(-)
MAIGMGTSMVDFMVRETRAIVSGNISIIRLGTCGTPDPNIPIGSVVVAEDSVMCYNNFDAFHDGREYSKSSDYYHITKPLPTDPGLTQSLKSELEKVTDSVVLGRDLTSDSFYSSQGRVDPSFDDHNSTLIDEIMQTHPTMACFQMETYHLCHLARISSGIIRGTAACIVLAQRQTGAFLSHERKHEMERICGKAVLDTLVNTFDGVTMDDDPTCVWNQKPSEWVL